MGRVLLNLYNNAFYAVQQRQKRAEVGYEPTVWVSTRLNGTTTMEICVRDNGTGIPDAIKAKIFQPFFTTKPTGEGTGLGLSLSYDIVTKGHGGTMSVETVEDEETTFTVILQTWLAGEFFNPVWERKPCSPSQQNGIWPVIKAIRIAVYTYIYRWFL